MGSLTDPSGSFITALVDFVRKSNNIEQNIEVIYRGIHDALKRDNTAMWVAIDDDGVIGFAVAEILNTQCFIRHAYAKKTGILKSGWRTILLWARLNRCSTINFITRRNAKAYERLMKDMGFRQKNVEFEVQLWAKNPEK